MKAQQPLVSLGSPQFQVAAEYFAGALIFVLSVEIGSNDEIIHYLRHIGFSSVLTATSGLVRSVTFAHTGRKFIGRDRCF